MNRQSDLFLTALAPAIWGTTFLVTTEWLPDGYPLTLAMLRALPAGLLLLLIARARPHGRWWGRIFVLGAFNFALFWTLLFVAAYRLPGGVAATVGAIQPLAAIFLARFLLGSPVQMASVLAALAGIIGVALLILTPEAALDPVGIAAGIGGALSMATGIVLSRKWHPPFPLLAFTAWQLLAGGLLLLPLALWLEPPLPPLSTGNFAGIAYLAVIGAAVTYVLWFRGIARIEPPVVAALGLFSPVTAVTLGWIALSQQLSLLQMVGVLIVLASVWLSQRSARRRSCPPFRQAVSLSHLGREDIPLAGHTQRS